MVEKFPYLCGGAGAAFLLDQPADTYAILEHPDGSVTLRQGAPYATVALNATQDVESARTSAWRVLQESLDALAARSRVALQTSQGEGSYLLWFRDNAEYELICVDTIDAPWSAQFQITTGGVFTPQVEPSMARHSALRFYRLSQASTDLFDAFRNAYLALECLVSDTAPKGSSEKELDWLKRVINGPLASGVPSGLPIDSTVEDIYLKGRNPIFHAKSGSTFYAPHGPEQQQMQELFEKLTLLLVCLLQHKFGSHAVRRWGTMSQGANDAQAHALFTFDELVLMNGDKTVALSASAEAVSAPRRFGQLWCRAFVQRPCNLESLTSIQTLKGGGEWIQFILNECIPLRGVGRISIELNLLQYNKSAPKPMHSR